LLVVFLVSIAPSSQELEPPAKPERFNLIEDIRAHGLLDPIVLFEKRILDGRSRDAACKSASVVQRYVEFEGTREEALMFVVSPQHHAASPDQAGYCRHVDPG
jgi:hypothetical protein